MKKMLLVLFSLFCAMGLFANGGGEAEKSGGFEVSAPGVYPVVSQPVTKRILVPQALSNVPDWSTNKASIHMEEVTGIHIEYDVAPDLNQARTLAIASDNLPDAFMGGVPPHEVIKYAAQGVFIPLDDLIDDHTVNIKKVMMEDPDLTDSCTTPDGNIYGLPQLNDDHHGKYGQKIWINTEWLENLGLDMPGTTEEFYDALVAFKTQDPNGNGKADEVPLSSSVNAWNGELPGNLLNAFLYVNFQMKGLYLDKGKVKNAFNDPRYREGLKYTAKLYKEGLIDPAAFTQNENQLKQLAENPEANLLGAASAGFWRGFSVDGGDSNRHKAYRTMTALKGPEGVQYTAYFKYKVRRDFFLISDACEQPEILIKWADYMFSPPGAYNVAYGPEGEGWKKPAPGQLGVNGLPAKFIRLSSDLTGNLNWGWGLAPMYQPASERLGEPLAVGEEYWDPSKIRTRLYDNVTTALVGHEAPDDMIMPPLYIPEKDVEEIGILEANLDSFMKESRVAFVTGRLDVNDDADWNFYLAELDKIGLDKWMALYQAAYDAR